MKSDNYNLGYYALDPKVWFACMSNYGLLWEIYPIENTFSKYLKGIHISMHIYLETINMCFQIFKSILILVRLVQCACLDAKRIPSVQSISRNPNVAMFIIGKKAATNHQMLAFLAKNSNLSRPSP